MLGQAASVGYRPLSQAERCDRVRLRRIAQESYSFGRREAERLAFWRWLYRRRGVTDEGETVRGSVLPAVAPDTEQKEDPWR